MRVTFAATHSTALAGIEHAAERLMMYQQQLATGRRFDRVSDDPAAAAAAMVERGDLAAVDHYVRSADAAESRLTIMDSVLSDIVNKLTSAQTTVLATRGTLNTPERRDAAALELRAVRDEVLQQLNTSYLGTYLFGGAAATTRPYVVNAGGTVDPYAGSTRDVQVEIDRGRRVAVAIDGSAITQGGAPVDLFASFDAAIAAVQAGDEAGMEAALAAFSQGFDRTVEMQSRIGTSLRAVEDQRVDFLTVQRVGLARLSKLEDVNPAEAASGARQASVAYEAALGAAALNTQLSLFSFLR